VQFVLPLIGTYCNQALVRWPGPLQRVSLFVAMVWRFTYAFLNQDFSVAYVAQNSNLVLPWYYRLSAVWAREDRWLWILILNLWTIAVAAFSRRLPDEYMARVIGVLGFVSLGFLLFTVLLSNPFARHLPPLADGNDLNPVLQDIGMIMHPPMLYMGYVGFAVVFAFAIAALLGGKLDQQWVRWSRP
jgi:cytochrome c-type biogenesis protein CcmF